jgi:RHS repeat-associated protein
VRILFAWRLQEYSVKACLVVDEILRCAQDDKSAIVLCSEIITSDPSAQAVDAFFGFMGRSFGSVSKLQNNLNRWYDPGVGRWISEDPIGFAGGDANLVRYTRNRPTNLLDPSGLKTFGAKFGGDLGFAGFYHAAIDVECHIGISWKKGFSFMFGITPTFGVGVGSYVGGGLSFQYTNAKSASDLKGKSSGTTFLSPIISAGTTHGGESWNDTSYDGWWISPPGFGGGYPIGIYRDTGYTFGVGGETGSVFRPG